MFTDIRFHAVVSVAQERAAARRDSVVLVELPGHVTAWVVTQHELLLQVLTDPRVTKSSWHSLESMTTADGAEHRRLRNLIVQAFTPMLVAALRPRIERITADLLDDLAAHREPGDDLTTGLIEAHDKGDRPTGSEPVGTLTIMIVAGHETTLDLLTNAVCALLTYPDQLALVLGGQHPWTAVIEETLRWDSPLGHLPMRYATEDVIIGGTVLPKGQAILASYVTAGRCPVYFGETADRFDITRPPKRHVMFGHGPHLARLEAEVALLALFARLPNLAMAAPVDNLTPIPSIVNNCARTLPVILAQ
jgi:cytochrome P450